MLVHIKNDNKGNNYSRDNSFDHTIDWTDLLSETHKKNEERRSKQSTFY
jgi:hypothetical protein